MQAPLTRFWESAPGVARVNKGFWEFAKGHLSNGGNQLGFIALLQATTSSCSWGGVSDSSPPGLFPSTSAQTLRSVPRLVDHIHYQLCVVYETSFVTVRFCQRSVIN